jgi:hypothetical protein
VPAPAHDQVRLAAVIEDPGVAQDVVDGVRDARRVVHVEAVRAEDRVVDVDDVAQHCEQVLLDAADHRAVDEGAGGRVLDFQLHAPCLAAEADLEILIAVEDRAHVVGFEARGQHGQRAAAEHLVDAAVTGAEQLLHFALGKILEAAERGDPRIDQSFRFELRDRRGGPGVVLGQSHGLISIGVSGGVMSQISTMSEFDTAMQPSVQSTLL